MRAMHATACFGFVLLALSACSSVSTGDVNVDLGGGVSMEMVLIHPGSFLMGSDKGQDNERPVHKVTLTKPFYLGKYEVTQHQWQAVMGENPAEFKGPNNPVEEVSWEDCQAFVLELTKKIPGKTFVLPTEAQWEYACRAGSRTEYAYGDDPAGLGAYAWYLGNSDSRTHPVGQKKPNAWGLYDMHGNVCEWCADWYSSAYTSGDATDPTGPSSGEAAVLRGESWVGLPDELRSADRVGTPIYYRNSHVGVRVVCLAPGVGE
jgi:formylglycine-generating enzyme required for sulfatase activity